MQSNGEASVFFDNCNYPNRPSIEDLGTQFGIFLANLRYDDGSAVPQVDVIAHSLGGLIVRSYLAGKQDAAGSFSPPASIPIRKIVFLATPHFGTNAFQPLLSLDTQLSELMLGGRFLYDLATWNQGTDDLRGADALAVVGNQGQGNPAGFSDGIVTLTSGSLEFAETGRTRVISACHITGTLATLGNLCNAGAPGIANITSATQDTARIAISFLNGTTEWQTIGQSAAQNSYLSTYAGAYAAWKNSTDQFLQIGLADYTGPDGVARLMPVNANGIVAYNEMIPAGAGQIVVAGSGQVALGKTTLAPGGFRTLLVKPGPQISRVFPAASAVFPLAAAPGSFISIYGLGLSSGTAAAASLPLTAQLGDAQVLINGSAIPLQFVSPAQINAVVPDGLSGLVPLTVKNSAGQHTVNLLLQPAVPAIFTVDQSGSGAAAAINVRTATLVGPVEPLQAGDYMELFLTGLGDTTPQAGLDVANQTPTVSVEGQPCAVTYAGRAPGFAGLDQINCIVPPGLTPNSAAPVVVQSGNRSSNVATLAIE